MLYAMQLILSQNIANISICYSYRIVTDLSARVNRLNPQWNSKGINIEEQFEKAMALVLEEFLEFVHYAKNIWLPARDIVQNAVNSRFEVNYNNHLYLFTDISFSYFHSIFLYF